MPFITQVFDSQILDFSHGEIKIAGEIPVAIQAFNHKQELKGTLVYGRNGEPVGQTRGQYTPECSIELLQPDFMFLLDLLGDGWGEKTFDIFASYTAQGQATHTKEAQGCRIVTDDFSSAVGADALKVKIDIQPILILLNGKRMMAQL